MPLKMYWPRLFLLFSKKYIVYIILTVMMFVGSPGFISLPSFMLLSAVVSEIRKSNRNKKKYFNNFPMHLISAFFKQSYILTMSTH